MFVSILICIFILLLYFLHTNTYNEGYKKISKKFKKGVTNVGKDISKGTTEVGNDIAKGTKKAVKNVGRGFKMFLNVRFIKFVKQLFTKEFLKKSKIGDDDSPDPA